MLPDGSLAKHPGIANRTVCLLRSVEIGMSQDTMVHHISLILPLSRLGREHVFESNSLSV